MNTKIGGRSWRLLATSGAEGYGFIGSAVHRNEPIADDSAESIPRMGPDDWIGIDPAKHP